jgi:hypothetical protein
VSARRAECGEREPQQPVEPGVAEDEQVVVRLLQGVREVGGAPAVQAGLGPHPDGLVETVYMFMGVA